MRSSIPETIRTFADPGRQDEMHFALHRLLIRAGAARPNVPLKFRRARESGRTSRSPARSRRDRRPPNRQSARPGVAARIPNATASPCRNRLYCVSASSAWPTVWPKFRMRRRSPSRSSAETTSALMRTASAIIRSTSAGCCASTLSARFIQQREQFGIANDAALDDFVQPGAILAIRQSGQHIGIDQHRQRLMKTADQILARRPD